MFQLQSITSADSKTFGANHVRTVENICPITAEILESDVRHTAEILEGDVTLLTLDLVIQRVKLAGCLRNQPRQIIDMVSIYTCKTLLLDTELISPFVFSLLYILQTLSFI